MTAQVREIVNALEMAIADQRNHLSTDDEGYEEGYLAGLERAANIVVIKAAGLMTGLDSDRR